MGANLADRLSLRELIENWAIWRDAGIWERFRTLWADDGRMMATWAQGTADEFIAMNRAGWSRGVSILHFLGGVTADVAGDRAATQTKITISQRAEVHGVLVDVVCTGRFHDFLSRTPAGWKMRLHQPIYEKDRMDPVDPAACVNLDAEVLARFPKATATSPICSLPSAIRSRTTCPASGGRGSTRSMRRAPPGWRGTLWNGKGAAGPDLAGC